MASTGNYEKGLAAYKSGDYATALRKFRPLAKQGLASAQSSLGWMYYVGQGVPKNDKTAVKWYRLAAEQGDAPAQYSLGVMYENGLGVPQDDKTALKWFTLSAKGKNEYAQSEVNRLQKKIAKTIRLLLSGSDLLRNRDMPVLSTIWVGCTTKEKVLLRTIRLP